MERSNKPEFRFVLYFIGGNEVYNFNKHLCDTYIKFHDSDVLFYISFYSKEFIAQEIINRNYFWNTDTIIVETIEKDNLYKVISTITDNGENKYHITNNFTNCGKFQDILGDVKDIHDLI